MEPVRASRALRRALVAAAMLLAASCQSLVGPPYQTPQQPPAGQPNRPPAAPGRATATPPVAPQPSTPPQPVPPPPQPSTRQFHLGAAANALVQQASREAGSGNPQLAQSTLERALRIEPANPLLWIMLGEAHESEGQYELAGSMGRKAVQLASGDPHAQASAWRLIGDSLRARGRNEDANDAYSRADTLAAQ
ncbi:MAG: tetratricopeptide repeat protein [Steroidobacteraceae bacterium]